MIGVDFCHLFCPFNTEKKTPVLSTPTKMMSQGYLSPRKKATQQLTLLEGSILMVSSGWISLGRTPSFHPCGNVFFLHPHISAPQKADTGAPSTPNPPRKDLGDRQEGFPSSWFCLLLLYLPKGGPWPTRHICTLRSCLWMRATWEAQAEPSFLRCLMWIPNSQPLMELRHCKDATGMKWKEQHDFIHVFYICTAIYYISYIQVNVY